MANDDNSGKLAPTIYVLQGLQAAMMAVSMTFAVPYAISLSSRVAAIEAQIASNKHEERTLDELEVRMRALEVGAATAAKLQK